MAEKRSELVNTLDRPDRSEDFATGRDETQNRSDFNTGLEASRREDWQAGEDQELTAEAENIKGRIKETRNQMGETIDAIQDKLSFSNISGQVTDHVQNAMETAKDAVYDATIGKAADFMKNVTNDISSTTVVRTAKENPLPFILIGLGAGLLAYKGYAGTLTPAPTRRRLTGYSDRTFEPQQPSTASATRGRLEGIGDSVATTAGNAMDKVTGTLDTAYAGAGEMVDRASVKAHDLKEAAVDKYQTYLEQNPLVLGAAVLAAGAAVGMAIPATRYEGELFGEKRNDLLNKAQHSAVGLLDKTKRAIVDGSPSFGTRKGSMIEH
jgi:hypothetical protein